MDRKTVVGWDGSENSSTAAEWARERESARHGTVALVRVIDDTRVSADYVVTQEAVDTASDTLEIEAALLRASAPHCLVTTTLVRGDPFEELLRLCDSDSMLALGTSRRSEASFRFGWSLGARLAAVAPGPVAIVPPPRGHNGSGVAVGVDASLGSGFALEIAAQEANWRGEPLILINAWQEPAIIAGDYTLDPELRDGLEQQSQDILRAASEKVANEYPNVALRRIVYHAPAALALAEAGREASVLVVGSRHLRGLKRLLLGSVSHGVLLNLACPTIVAGQRDPAHPVSQPRTLAETLWATRY
jgi:nucleotide-binding universal stress UspA family protein